MRIALVSPYSWTYPGGVTRHIQALAEHYAQTGHHVRVLAPVDPDDRLAAVLHRGASPQRLALPDYLIPLGRTVGIPANGAVSNLSVTPYGLLTLRRELAAGRFDVVHVHEPVAPVPSWDACVSTAAPLVGTFHSFSEALVPNTLANLVGARRVLNHLHVRIAVSEAAAWTGRRFYGGHYRVIPNGVHVHDAAGAEDGDEDASPGRPLRIAFVGQAVERKGLPVLLRAFEALREHIPVELTVVGAGAAEVSPLLVDPTGVTALGKVSDQDKRRVLARADVLAVPSLGGESFGMVLTEAFAAGTPVVASDLAGYRGVVRDGVDGVLVPRGDPTRLAEALRDLWLDPGRRLAMAREAAAAAPRFAWPRVAAEVMEAYRDAIATPRPEGALARAAVRVGARPADLRPREPARRLPSPEPAPERRPAVAVLRRVALLACAMAALLLAAHALDRIGIDRILASLVHSSPAWVVAALGLMCLSMCLRALAWHQILQAALPRARLRLSCAFQGTFIGVLMSATLPARLGEPSRALIVARHTGRPRESLPVVLGTLVSQTLLNLLALLVLGIVMLRSVGLFHGHAGALFLATTVPVVVLLLVLAAPALLARGRGVRSARARALVGQARRALAQVRDGLAVFRQPRRGVAAAALQLAAWGVQWIACFLLLVAFGLDGRAGIGAAAAVLFAVNVTAALPATPANLGIFQAACVAVLAGAYGVSSADALGYGVILQAVEIATAVMMGAPALVKEGVSWRDVKLRAMQTAPVELARARREPAPAKARAR